MDYQLVLSKWRSYIEPANERRRYERLFEFYFSLILDNEIDKKYLIESNNEFKTLPASEEIFQNQIQVLNTEITAKKFKQQEAEFRLKGTYWFNVIHYDFVCFRIHY